MTYRKQHSLVLLINKLNTETPSVLRKRGRAVLLFGANVKTDTPLQTNIGGKGVK